MTRLILTPDDLAADDLERLPGLFRRWELAGILREHRRYHLDDAGRHADGTPLVAVYVEPAVAPDQTVAAEHLSEGQLAARWNLSPRTLQRWRWAGRGPGFLKLNNARVAYPLREIEEYEVRNLIGGDRRREGAR